MKFVHAASFGGLKRQVIRNAAFFLIFFGPFFLIPATASTAVERPVILSATEVDYPPFSIIDENGQANGFSVELFRAALAAMGRDVTFKTGLWANVRQWLVRGKVQALPLVGRTPEREFMYDFTVPYMTLHGAIITRKGTDQIHNLEDLRGKRVAVMQGDNAEEFLRRESRGINILTTPTFEIALQDLHHARYDAVVMQRLVALRLIQKSGLTDLVVIDHPIEGFQQQFCFAVKEGDRETLALLNEGLAIVMANGTYRYLHAKWFAALELPPARSIIVGGNQNFYPFEFLNEKGIPTGFCVELTQAIAAEMGIDIEIDLGPWPETIQKLESDQIDILECMFYSPSGDLKLDFSPAHTTNSHVGVVRRNMGNPPENLADLAGKRIIVQNGDAIHSLLLQTGLNDQINLADSEADVLRELSEGNYDCGLVTRIGALSLIEKNDWKNLVLSRKPFISLDYSYATLHDRNAVIAKFSEGLKAIEQNGEYRRIYDKWLGVYQQNPPRLWTAIRYSALVLLPLIGMLLAVSFWTWSLRRKVAEKTKALQESLDRFQYVFEAANVGKSMTLPTGEINANKAFADFLGYAPDELNGITWQEITPQEDIALTEQKIAPLLAGEKSGTRFEKRYRHRNGSILWADVSVIMRYDPAGKPLYFITTVVDITLKKQAEAALQASEEFQRAMIECSPVALYVIDLVGNVLAWNQSAERILGWSAAEVIGKPLPFVGPENMDEFARLRKQVMDGQVIIGKEIVRHKKDGSRFDGSLSTALIRDPNGQMYAIMAAMEDITQKKLAENNLKWNTRRNEILSDTAAQLLQSVDPQKLVDDLCFQVMTFLDCQVFLNFLQVERSKSLHLNAWAGISKTDIKKIEWLEDGMAECGRIATLQQYIDYSDFSDLKSDQIESFGIQAYCCHPIIFNDRVMGTLSFGSRTRNLFNPEEIKLMESVTHLVAVALHRIESENELRESESRFRLFAELVPVGLLISDKQENILYVSPKFTQLMGYSQLDLTSIKQWWNLACPDPVQKNVIQEQWQTALQTADENFSDTEVLEYPVLCKNGIIRQIESRVSTTGNLNVIVFSDISGRKQAEKALAHSHELMRFIIDRANNGVAVHDRNLCYIYVSQRYLEMYKISDQNIIGKHHYEVFPDLPQKWRDVHQKALSGEVCQGDRDPFLRADGSVDFTRWECRPWFEADGSIGGIIVYTEVITRQIRNEQSLREYSERLELAEKNALLGSWEYDFLTGKEWWSQQMYHLLSFDSVMPEPPDFATYLEHIHPDDRKFIEPALRRLQIGTFEPLQEYRSNPQFGPLRYFSPKVQIINDDKGNARKLLGTILDITDLKQAEIEREKLQSQLYQAQKLESVGRLAGGIAHDYNNMLGVIIGYTELALEYTPQESQIHNDLHEVLKAALRSSDITRQLLTYARKQAISPKIINLNEAVMGTLKMLARLIGEDIELIWRPASDVRPIFIDPSQLDQILVNLCVNARDAINGVGKIIIETQNILFDEEYCELHTGFIPGNFIQLSISDDGCGMDDTTLANLFEPFFTTKKVGKGTGLGLATVYGIVKQNLGFINVYSELGKGTTFRIYLPRHTSEADTIDKAALFELPRGRGEVIFIVEDESAILRMTKTKLEQLGYVVLDSTNPGEAITMASEYSAEIQLLITDVVMPEMNGLELANSIKNRYPDLKILYMSGYTADVIAHRGVLETGINFLQKPFSSRELALKVYEALNR